MAGQSNNNLNDKQNILSETEESRKKASRTIVLCCLGMSLVLIVLHGCYMLMGHLDLERHIISVPFDYQIPFCEWFAIPYVAWYGYVFFTFLFLIFASIKDFFDIGIYVSAGLFICCVIFMVYPTQIDFRVEDFPRDNLCTDILAALFAADKPYNVLPSIHCFESAAIFIGVCKSRVFRGHTSVKIFFGISAALICLSTLFVKQHSVLDLLAGIGLAIVLYFVIYRLILKRIS